jgi:shikimate dehydrogenase
MKKKFAVLGYPVKHSLSPKIFNFLGEFYNLDFSYEILEIEPKLLSDSFDTLKEFDGLNITSPYKEKILEFCKYKSSDVEALRAANVLKKKNADQFEAYNTDVYGFKESLSSWDLTGMKALVFGSSGAARAAILGLKQLGVTDITMKARNVNQYTDQKPNIVVQATTIGMTDTPVDMNFFNVDYSDTEICCDLIYYPKITPFMDLSKKNNVEHVINGESMLIHQALKTFELWFDIKPDKNAFSKLKEIL